MEEHNEKNIRGLLLAVILITMLSISTAFAKEPTFVFPLDIKVGMNEYQLYTLTAHYGGRNNVIEIANVSKEFDNVSVRLLFDTPVSMMTCRFLVDSELRTINDRQSEFDAIEKMLEEKYGDTDFVVVDKGGNCLYSNVDALENRFLWGAGETATQRIVKYDGGGYVIITHCVYKERDGSLKWNHILEYRYVGEDFPIHDNKIHQKSISFDDIL